MTKKLKLIGWGLTLLYLAVLTYLGWGRWDSLQTMDLNAVGDFLAGAGGPLALLWLILGFYQQGEELKRSTEALNLQADELRHSVAQQQALVEVSREQVKAQTEALEYERELQRRVWSPDFELVCTPQGASNGGERSYHVTLHNHGAKVKKVSVRYEGGGAYRKQFPLGTLDSSEPATFDVPNASAPTEPAFIRINYLDGGGQVGERTFRMTFHVSRINPGTTVGFDRVE